MSSTKISPFMLARRRNQLLRLGPSVLARLVEIVGISPGSAQFIPADDSLHRQQYILELLGNGTVPAVVSRLSSVSIEVATAHWQSVFSSELSEMVICDLFNYPDFEFEVQACELFGRLDRLLAFDGDTVTVTSGDMHSGIVIDMCVEDGATVYEVDRWGSWASAVTRLPHA